MDIKLYHERREMVLSHTRDVKLVKLETWDNIYTKIFDLNSMIDQSESSSSKNCVIRLCNKAVS